MDKREEGLREKYTENLLERVGKKIVAKKFNVVAQLDYKVELSEEERLAYEVVLLKVEKKLQRLGFERYFSEDFEDITKVASELRISRRTYYSQRKELLAEVDKYLTSKGYGYNNASDVVRYGHGIELQKREEIEMGIKIDLVHFELVELVEVGYGNNSSGSYYVNDWLNVKVKEDGTIERVDIWKGSIKDLKVIGIERVSIGKTEVVVWIDKGEYTSMKGLLVDLRKVLDLRLGKFNRKHIEESYVLKIV